MMQRTARLTNLCRIARCRNYRGIKPIAGCGVTTDFGGIHCQIAQRAYSSILTSNHILKSGLRNGKCTSNQQIRFYSSDLPEHKVVGMPNLSPTMETGTIIAWLKEEGDKIEEGDALAEIETDKSTMVSDSSEEGYLAKILIPEGTKDVPVGTPLYVMVYEESDVSAFANFSPPEETSTKDSEEASSEASEDSAPPSSSKSAPLPTPPPPPKDQGKESAPSKPASRPSDKPAPAAAKPSSSDGRVIASPLAKRLAAEQGLDLQALTGSGPGGRIIASDLTHATSAPAAAATAASYTDIDLSSMRKTIAKRLTQSKQTVPHYYLTVDIHMDNIMKLRSELNETLSGDGIKLSVNDFVIKAASLACKKIPAANSAWMDNFIRQYDNVDMCVAVATDKGLITPIVAKAETKGLASINLEVASLAAKAREGKLQPHEFQGGTFTISNLGMFGVKSFTAIINPPQACILAVGSTQKKLVPDQDCKDGYRTADVMSVTLSCDHRVVDGAVGAQWLAEFRKLLESPTRMML